MLPLRYPWVWWTCGWLLVAAVCIGSLVPAPLIAAISIQDKILHAGAYATLMLWFSGLFRRQRLWLVALLLFALGIALDLLQGTSSTRTLDWRDVAANSGGILLAFILSFYVFEGWCLRIEQWLAR
jgi:VanZ family protein